MRANRIWMLSMAMLLMWASLATAAAVYWNQSSANILKMYEAERERSIDLEAMYSEVLGNFTRVRRSTLQVAVSIDFGNGTVLIFDDLYVSKGASALEALKGVADVKVTYWATFNAFVVDEIDCVRSNEKGNNRWWGYAVNGEYATISADQFVLREGDRVEWIYTLY